MSAQFQNRFLTTSNNEIQFIPYVTSGRCWRCTQYFSIKWLQNIRLLDLTNACKITWLGQKHKWIILFANLNISNTVGCISGTRKRKISSSVNESIPKSQKLSFNKCSRYLWCKLKFITLWQNGQADHTVLLSRQIRL